MKSETRLVAFTVVLAAIAIVLSPLAIPLAGARVLPWQHMVNVIGAAVVGPVYNVIAALVTSIARNALGTGTLFAFPGSMIGALLAGLTFRYTRNVYFTALAEIIGTGIIGAIVSTVIWGPLVMQRQMPTSPEQVFALVIPFLTSVIPGAILGVLGLKVLERAGYVGRRGWQMAESR